MITLDEVFERAKWNGSAPVPVTATARRQQHARPPVPRSCQPGAAAGDELLTAIVKARDSLDRSERTGARVFQRLLPGQQDAWRALGLCDTYLCWTTALLKQRMGAARRAAMTKHEGQNPKRQSL